MDHIEFKAAITVDEEGHIEGIAWPFGSPDRVGDEIMPGSFAKAIGPLPMLAFHDQRDSVGVWDTITETAKGLVVKGRLLVKEVARAAEMRALIREKAVGGLSIGFATRKAAPRKGGGRTITDLDLMEISIVAVPAHPGARITSAKAAAAGKEASMADNEQGAAPEIAELTTKMGEFETTLKGFKIPDLTKIEDRLAKVEAKANRPGADQATDDETAKLERKAFGTYLRMGNQIPADEAKALTVSNDEQGGYLAPAEMSTEIIDDLIELSPIRAIASVRTITSPSVKYPKRTGITNAQWEGELEESNESTVTFGQAEVTARKLMTYVDISNELLADSGGTAEAEVRRALADDFALKEGLAFLTGDGVKQPEGILTNPDIDPFLNGHATTLNADKLIAMMYDLPAAYRNNGSWLLNGTSLGIVRTLKDATSGAYLWQPGLQAGQPSTLLGRPVYESVDMPDIGSGNFPIIYGDFNRAYRIVDRLAMSVLVNPYSLATKGVTRIHATRRVGGRVIQPAALRKLKMATS